MKLDRLIKDISKIDTADIISEWLWLFENQKQVVLVSSIGDMFLENSDNAIYWLDIGMAELTCVAENLTEFKTLLSDEISINNWFLPGLVDQLIDEGKILKHNEVYSFKKPPILGGDFSPNNFDTTDISVHFSIWGHLHRQIWDARDGTNINEVILK